MSVRETDWAAGLRGPRWWTEAQAQQVLTRLEESGQSVSAFAKRIGVSAKRIYWWRQQLDARAQPSTETPLTTAPQFVPVVVRASQQPSTDGPLLAVRLGEQLRVEVYRVDQSTASWVAVLAAELSARVSP